MPSIAPLTSLSALRFAGTGPNGVPKVLVAKADYKVESPQRSRFKTPLQHLLADPRPPVALVGIATTADEFITLLDAQKPDVVIYGSTFGLRSNQPAPGLILESWMKKNPSHPMGLILNSSFHPLVNSQEDRLFNNTSPAQNVQFVPDSIETSSEKLIQAILDADPVPVQTQKSHRAQA